MTVSRFESAEVPFIQIGNRRALTRMQLEDNPELMRFYQTFKRCFEVALDIDAVLFIEPEDRHEPPHGTAHRQV